MVYIGHLKKILIKLDNVLNICGWKQGNCLTYYENGRIWMKTDYVNNKRHGRCLRWDENGQLYEKSKYINDRLSGEFLEYQDGVLLSRSLFGK